MVSFIISPWIIEHDSFCCSLEVNQRIDSFWFAELDMMWAGLATESRSQKTVWNLPPGSRTLFPGAHFKLLNRESYRFLYEAILERSHRRTKKGELYGSYSIPLQEIGSISLKQAWWEGRPRDFKTDRSTFLNCGMTDDNMTTAFNVIPKTTFYFISKTISFNDTWFWNGNFKQRWFRAQMVQVMLRLSRCTTASE